ncbi:hypothetical protein GCM10017783_00270 [Deinococcus piscis]|uniref:Uncharacterized protein n=1 Tax=Deinococcus piscis TaxID=394230 RepID=A0ABQ3JZ97_9DEIO|nr:hypothetical protein [Deinococcus piscis]GHF92464.1 hypothetical protein GCM10017783_00270 [Deinococcus piscis]
MNKSSVAVYLLVLSLVGQAYAQAPVMETGASFTETGFCKLYGCKWLSREELLSRGQPSGIVEYSYQLTKIPDAQVHIWRTKADNAVVHAILLFRPVKGRVTPETSPVKVAAQFTRDLTGYSDWKSVPTKLLAFCGPNIKPENRQELFATPVATATCSWSPQAYDEAGRNVGSQLTLMFSK